MRVVAALRSGPDVTRVVQALKGAGHELVLAWSLDELSAALAAAPADAVVVDSGFTATADATLVAQVRPRVATTTTIVVLLPDTWPGDVAALFDAGADDVVRRPLMAAEVALRVARRSDARLARLSVPICPWDQFAFWRELEPLVRDTLLDMVGVELVPEPAPQRGPLAVAGFVVMALPSDKAECVIGIGVDARGASALAAAMLGGDDSPALVADAVGELANAAAGAIKRAALPAGKTMTIGLPRIIGPLTPPATIGRAWQLRFPDGALLTCLAAMRSVRPALVPCGGLRPGMVLHRDVLAPTGALLATQGACLTDRTVDRLRALLGDQSTIEVLQPSLAL